MRVLQSMLPQQKADWSAAQSIYDNPRVAGNPAAIQSIAYPRTLKLTLLDGTITGPGSRTWFKRVRDNVVLCMSVLIRPCSCACVIRIHVYWQIMMDDCNFVMTDSHGRAVMLWEEDFSQFTSQCTIYRVVSGSQPVQIARITREVSVYDYEGDYSVRVFNPSELKVTYEHYYDGHVVFKSRGGEATTIRTITYDYNTLSNNYKVTVQPGHDLLLFLSLTYCLDRLGLAEMYQGFHRYP